MSAVEVRKGLQINRRSGEPLETIDNFLTIMEMDQHYSNIRYNELTNCAEIHDVIIDGELTIVKWNDAQEAASENYMEQMYGIYSPHKHEKALRLLFEKRKYNPIRDIIDNLEWDGLSRIEDCLSRWMRADDSEYTKEVSRLIFAGGINRLYNPGCKFDDVPVLVGTRQGEGKSTFIQWLAVNDQWFTEIKKVDGSEAIEQLFGAWICEIPELSAFKKADDVESIKAFVTRTKDKYRKPYDRNPTEYPRRCILVGSTNSDRFLTDRSGNRRFYPVIVHSSGYDLFDHEEECKAYILQCWAEARERYKAGNMLPYADYKLLKEYRERQEEAMEDDWRVGKISAYLERFAVGMKICAIQIYKDCLFPDSSQGPKPYESREIGQIVGKFPDWEKCGRFYTEKYGQQRGWVKIEPVREMIPDEDGNPGPFWEDDTEDEEIPFPTDGGGISGR